MNSDMAGLVLLVKSARMAGDDLATVLDVQAYIEITTTIEVDDLEALTILAYADGIMGEQ